MPHYCLTHYKNFLFQFYCDFEASQSKYMHVIDQLIYLHHSSELPSPLTHNKIKFSSLQFWDSFSHSTIHLFALFGKLTQGACKS